jgi:3-hydroxybutyryl-CoA dehydrogenase
MIVNNILVIGSGVMGRGIAYSAALGGYQVTLCDISQSAIENAKSEIGHLFLKAVDSERLTSEKAEHFSSKLNYSTELEKSASSANFVIEAVPEVMSIKKDIFEKLDQYTSTETILATNTSTMSPTEIGSYTNRADRTIAMHFFNPVHKMKLVEIIKGLETSDETLRVTQEVAHTMGKETVGVNEFPGFVTSRISSLVGNEAFNMLMEGVGSPEEIDKAIELGLNYPMGPFKLGDLVGLDTRLKNLEYLHKTLGEKYRPSPLLVKYVKAGRLGRKSGKGVYNYT